MYIVSLAFYPSNLLSLTCFFFLYFCIFGASAPSLSVSVDSAAPSVDPVVQVPPPLMSLVTTPPQPSDHSNAVDEDPAASQASLFSSEAPIRSFSDDEMMPNPVLTPSPSIFSFTGLSEDSQSIRIAWFLVFSFLCIVSLVFHPSNLLSLTCFFFLYFWPFLSRW